MFLNGWLFNSFAVFFGYLKESFSWEFFGKLFFDVILWQLRPSKSSYKSLKIIFFEWILSCKKNLYYNNMEIRSLLNFRLPSVLLTTSENLNFNGFQFMEHFTAGFGRCIWISSLYDRVSIVDIGRVEWCWCVCK